MKSRREGKCSDPCEISRLRPMSLADVPLERLVAIDAQNPPAREAEAAALLAFEFEAICFATEVRPVADDRANVVERIDDAPGPCFAFDSHMNTVLVGGGWTSDPFRLTGQDGKLFSRGTGDAERPMWGLPRPAVSPVASRPMARHAGHDVRRRRRDRRPRFTGSRERAAKARLDRYLRADEQCGLRSSYGLSAAAYPRQGRPRFPGRPELSVTAILAAGHLTSLVDERDRELRAKPILSWVMPA